MKTLKEELQEILDEDKLNQNTRFICINLSSENKLELAKYREMAKNYAREYITDMDYVWWYELSNYVISEKYRFIKDLIKLL